MDYNGWTNYETWLTVLWMENDKGLYYILRGAAEELAKTKNPALKLAEYIKDIAEEMKPDMEPCLMSDLLNSAIHRINFYEIATHYIDEI